MRETIVQNMYRRFSFCLTVSMTLIIIIIDICRKWRENMPRPQRCRKICDEPEFNEFMPAGMPNGEVATLSLDEYEVLRLVDYERCTHEECARQMDISRTTVTEIYEAARYKLADCVVNGKRLLISGGNYRICEGAAFGCRRVTCRRAGNDISDHIMEKRGEHIMRIAVTYENGQIFQHFGHTEQFKVYDVENGQIIAEQIVDTNGQGHGALAGFLLNGKVDVLICGGIGGGAQNALANAGITLYGGVSGNADEAVKALIAGNLAYNPNIQCSHHGVSHSCSGHTCG